MPTKADRLTNELSNRILQKAWDSGERLPTVEGLMAESGLSRGTVRTALDRLCERGMIYKAGNSWYVERRAARR